MFIGWCVIGGSQHNYFQLPLFVIGGIVVVVVCDNIYRAIDKKLSYEAENDSKSVHRC